MTDAWSHEETDDPRYATRRNFYKVENGQGWAAGTGPQNRVSRVGTEVVTKL